jgi:hypothetical protein
LSQVIDAKWLLDVNALIAFLDLKHVHHAVMREWFFNHSQQGWATCPISENGAIRVLFQPTYPSGRRTPAEVIRALHYLKNAQSEFYSFFPDDVSFTHKWVLEFCDLIQTATVADVYLLALAHSRKARLVSFDRKLPWQAIQGASANLVEHPA